MKIRIFALARELGLDSKVLIGLCDEAGIQLRNALATLTPEERDQVVAYVKGRDQKGVAPEDKPEALAPTRDANAGKVRDIRLLPATPQESSEPEQNVQEAQNESAVAESAAETVEATPAAVVDAETAAAVEEVETPATDTDSEAAPAEEAEDQSDTPTVDTPTVDTPTTESNETAAPQKQASPIQRMSRPVQREMKPIGSIKDREQQPERTREKDRDKPAGRPLVAAPPVYQPPAIKPKPKKTAEKAMKPDVALADIVDRASPLAVQLQQLKEAKADHDENLQGTKRKPGGARRGSLLKDFQNRGTRLGRPRRCGARNGRQQST